MMQNIKKVRMIKFVKISDREGKTNIYEIFKDDSEDICLGTICFNPMYGTMIYEPVDENPCGLTLDKMIEIVNFGLQIILKMKNINMNNDYNFHPSS